MKKSILVLIISLVFITGCESKDESKKSTATNRVAIVEAEKKIILRCLSTLTKTGKPCQNKVKEDSFCHLHATLEEAREKVTAKKEESN
jgi:hypothetical protein